MKTKCLLMCLIFVVCTAQVQARPDHKIYLPLFIFPKMDGTMGLWSYVEPEVAINLITNSSFETNTVGWLGSGNNTIARTSDQQKFGVYSLECTQGEVASLVMAQYAITFPVAGTYTLSAWIYLTPTWDAGAVSLRFRDFAGSTIVTASTSVSATGNWTRIALTVAVVGGDLVGNLDVILSVAAGNNEIAYVDAVDCVLSPYATTHVDGDQPGCEWLGAAHASTSQRSALSRAGGRVINFDDLNFDISGMFGAGMSPITVNVDPFAILPGAEINSIKTDERTFTLSGWVRGESLEDLHANRQAIIDALKPNAVPGNQPVLLRYTGAVLTKEIAATYEAGLAGTIRGEFPCLEQNFTLRFLAADPNWYEIGNSAAVLDSIDTITTRYVAGRLRSTGQWDNLGVAANPTANGTIYAVLYNPTDNRVYYGGDFQGFATNGGWDYLVAYNLDTGAFERVGPGGSVSAAVYALANTPNGDVLVGGNFVNLGGGAGDYVSIYDISADAFVPLGAGGTIGVRALAVGSNGDIFIGGTYANWNGIPAADYMVLWDFSASAYVALGTGGAGGNGVEVLAIDPLTGDCVAGGDYTSMGGVANTDSISLWDISAGAWISISSGIVGGTTEITGLAYDDNGLLYVGGSYTSIDGVTASNISSYNRIAFSPLGVGVNSDVDHIVIAPDGRVYMVGGFTLAGGFAVNRIAFWTGTSWARTDADLVASSNILAIDITTPDPVIASNYSIFIGMQDTGESEIGGIATVTNDGTEDAFPLITLTYLAGIPATQLTLTTLRNETLGLELLFAYDFLIGETLTIDLSPTNKSVVSSIFGSRLDAVLPNSDFGTWRLGPDNNDVTLFIDPAFGGAPTLETTIQWRDPYWAAD